MPLTFYELSVITQYCRIVADQYIPASGSFLVDTVALNHFSNDQLLVSYWPTEPIRRRGRGEAVEDGAGSGEVSP
jgi:hypothetical protein